MLSWLEKILVMIESLKTCQSDFYYIDEADLRCNHFHQLLIFYYPGYHYVIDNYREEVDKLHQFPRLSSSAFPVTLLTLTCTLLTHHFSKPTVACYYELSVTTCSISSLLLDYGMPFQAVGLVDRDFPIKTEKLLVLFC